MKKKIKAISYILLFSLFIISCSEKTIPKYEDSRFLFGTYIKIIVYDKSEKLAKKSMNKAFKEIERIDSKFNSKKEGSLIYQLNSSPDKEVKLDKEGLEIFEKIKQTYLLSEGRYDVTIGPLLELWGFTEEKLGSTKLKVPKKEEIEFLKNFIGFDKVKIEDGKFSFTNNLKCIDTGSFLKGYAIAKAKKVLQENGIKQAFITSISSIELIGDKPGGKPWKIGIQNPINPSGLLGVVSLKDKALGISGDYQTFLEIEGKMYHHILDKETGYPVKDKKMVVVICDDGFKADLYSTAFFLMPLDKVMKIVKQDKDLEVLIVDKDMKIISSKNFKIEKIKK